MAVKSLSGAELTGTWTKWTLFDKTREYGTVQSLSYAEAVELVKPVPFKGETGKGQQRALVMRHVRKIKQELRAGNFTPTPVSAALEDCHRERLALNDGTFTLQVDAQAPLLLTDGGHRFEAIGELIADLEGEVGKAKTEEERANLNRWLEQAKAVPCTVTVYFDGDPQVDFVNLQAGRSVDTSHMRSLALHAKGVKPEMGLAFEVARALHKDARSPFHREVKFDSGGNRRLPIATLTASGPSDIGTSLVGLARVGLAAGKGEAFLAAAVTDAYDALDDASAATESDAGILGPGKALTPVAYDGTKGSSTMLVGVGVCLAHRLVALRKDKADAEDLAHLVAVAERTLNVSAKGNFSGPLKRQLLGQFAREFFGDATEPRHGGVPIPLLKALSCSTFNVKPLPKEKVVKPGRSR